MKTSTGKIAILACVAIALSEASAQGQDIDTLKKIKSTQTITVGHRDASSPFSYNSSKGQPVGYSIDVCMKIVEAIRAELQSPGIAIKWHLVTGASRISMVANGTVDIECGSTTNTIERQQQVSFVVTTFVAATRLALKKSTKFNSLDDLKGKTVVAVAGTTNLRHITALNSKRGLGMTIVPAKENAAAFAMVEKGDAIAFATDDILLYDLIANAKSPGDYVVAGDPLSIEPYGMMIRKDDPAFKKISDDTVRGLFKSGEIQKIYGKWFLSPIEPKNIVLNAPVGEALKKAFAEPTDSALATTYSGDAFFK